MTDKKTQGYINVHDVDPDIIVDLKYATTDNFTHQVVYDLTRQFLESIPFTSLPKQVRTSRVKGTESKIWDAYRPTYAQKRLFEVYPDPIWVAEPDPNFSHQKGLPLTSH